MENKKFHYIIVFFAYSQMTPSLFKTKKGFFSPEWQGVGWEDPTNVEHICTNVIIFHFLSVIMNQSGFLVLMCMLNSFQVNFFFIFVHVSNNPIQDPEENENLAKGDTVENQFYSSAAFSYNISPNDLDPN